MQDHGADDPLSGVWTFVIECKRLGDSGRSDWVLNQNYVNHGIIRFIAVEHGYARNDGAGAMVGYVQNMDLPDILAEVNTAASSAGIPDLLLSGVGWKPDSTSLLDHILTRSEGVSPFHLAHFWVDLRNR
jgi:hypothetical protein